MSMHPSPCLVQKQYHTSNSFLKSWISPSKHYEDCVLGRRLATSAASHRFWDFEAPDVLQSWLLPRPDLMFRLGWRTKSQQRIPNLTDLSDTSGCGKSHDVTDLSVRLLFGNSKLVERTILLYSVALLGPMLVHFTSSFSFLFCFALYVQSCLEFWII